ncbi:MAG TPA: energy transducer TonB [Thioploca sp.]|nr:energy transducer TonB [Thioploca sp.]
MRNISIGLLISLIIHIGIVYSAVYFLQILPTPEKIEIIPISLNMFQPEPLPVFKTISSELPTIAKHLDFAPLPIIKHKSRIIKTKVKQIKKRKYKKKITKIKPHQSKKSTVKTKAIKAKPQIVEIKPMRKIASQMIQNKARIDKSKEAEKTYQRKLNRLIAQKKIYPRKAKRMGQQGVVRMLFTVLANGKIKNIIIEKSSGSSSLDKAAKKLIQRISGLLPFNSLIKRKRWQFHIDIKYQLH